MAEESQHVVSIIGDSNVQRNLVDYNCGNREIMREAQLIPCTSFSVFGSCLPRVRPEATILILACLSNFLRDSDASDVGEFVVHSSIVLFIRPTLMLFYINFPFSSGAFQL